jgi:hypothetical protein
VASKVQTLDGRWLAIDGGLLFKANVAASETYNTALEQHLRDNLGVRFAERPGTDPAKRPIREIVGVDTRLNQRWSTRRAHIKARRGELAVQFQHDHGRPLTPVEALHLAQQATLETRDAKHEPRSLAEQRATWHDEAAAVLGSSEAVASMVRTALTRAAETATSADARWVAQTAGVRLQLAIAPAGAGKTTAMRALTLAWTEDGGQVLGLAPSAAAAAVLAEQTGIRTDTLAKLTWSLHHGDLPDWAAAVGPSTLVIIDEAGMADTLSPDTAVQFAIRRGASVRLVGDDQQLAAIGPGGVLRDIKHTHGALQLTELHRFTDPAEAAASLALREGKPEALDFYLKHGRVHVGDLTTTTEDAFKAWAADQAAGLDAIMLAPTRDLVADLNRRARAHRLNHSPAAPEVGLADGNQAGVGDVIITRTNDRRLRLAPTDLGQKRRPLGHHPCRQTRRPDRATHPEPPHRPAASRLRPAVDRTRRRHHHPRRPGRHRRHHARPANRP